MTPATDDRLAEFERHHDEWHRSGRHGSPADWHGMTQEQYEEFCRVNWERLGARF